MNNNELPTGWVWTTIGEISQVNPRMIWPEHLFQTDEVSFLPMAAVDDLEADLLRHSSR